MSDGFTIGAAGAAGAASTLFSCPQCNETIDASSEKCRFCGAPVNPDYARHAAEVLTRINQACSDASYMRSTALSLPVFFVLRFLPILSMLGTIGWTALLIGIPIWAAIWWIRYNAIETADQDFVRARKTVLIVGIVAGSLLLISMILFLVFFAAGFLAVVARHH